jgi:hypothetical protein
MRKELEKRALRAAKEVAPKRSGGLKKAIKISRSTETGYTLGVSESLTEGERAATKVESITRIRKGSVFSSEKSLPKELRRREITKPSPVFTDSWEAETRRSTAYHIAVAAENKRLSNAWAKYNQSKRVTSRRVVSLIAGEKYNPYVDGGSKVRANMQEFGYPYATKRWGPYKPNPNAPKGTSGLGYLRYGQVLAAKSLTKDSIAYDTPVSPGEVVRYEKTIQDAMIKAFEILLAKYLRKQKLPAYYRGIDKLKQKAPIPERAKAYGNVTSLNLNLDLAFPRNPYSNLESGRKLANISQSVTGREFARGSEFLIEDPLPF